MAITGIQQAAVWDLTAGITPKSPGLVVGGGPGTTDPRSIRYGVGGQSSFWAGPVAPGSSLEVEATSDTGALILNAIRSSYVTPALVALKIKIGTAAVNFEVLNALINRLRCSGQPDGPLVCSMDFVSLTETETAAIVSPVALGSEVFPWGGGSVTVGGAAYDCQGFDLEIDNAVTHCYDLDAKGSDVKRLPTATVIGQEKISLSVQTLDPITWDVNADTPVVNLAAVIIYALGVTSITFTFSNLSWNGVRGMPLQRESGLVVWSYGLIGKPGSLVITTA